MIEPILATAQHNGHASTSMGVMEVAWLPAVTALVVFLVAFGILYVKVWPRIVQGLDDREKKIRDSISEAESAREQAKQALAEYEKSVATARQEAEQTIARARADARALGEELHAKNEEELAAMKSQARREIQAAKQTAIAELHAEASTLAAVVAGKILQREISAEDQQQLVEEALDELGRYQQT